MTEVDEEAARSLDSGDADQDEGETSEAAEPEQTQPEADFSGPHKPDGAKPGQSWFNPEDGKLRYAHATQHGMKWYLQPPQQDEAPKQEVAAQQAATSDPAPEQASASNDPYHGEAFAEKRREIIDLLNSAGTKDQVKFAENLLTRFYVSFPEKVQQEIEDKVAEAKDRISG